MFAATRIEAPMDTFLHACAPRGRGINGRLPKTIVGAFRRGLDVAAPIERSKRRASKGLAEPSLALTISRKPSETNFTRAGFYNSPNGDRWKGCIGQPVCV